MSKIQFSLVIILLWGDSLCQKNKYDDETEGAVENKDPLQELLAKFPVLKGVEEINVCKHIKHYSTSSYTCCNGEKYPVAISFDENFKSCFIEPSDNKESFTASIWRLYTCLVKKNIPDENNLIKFAEKMSLNLPPEIKDKIMERMKKQSVIVDENKIPSQVRVIYHHIEREMCENVKDETKPDTTNLLKCIDGADIIRENMHNRGDCCQSKTIPMALELFRRPPTLNVKKCTKTLMYTLPQKPIYYIDFDYAESDAQQLCHTACVLKELGILDNVKLKPDIPMNEEHEPLTDFIFEPETAMAKLTKLFSIATKEETVFHEQLVFDDPYNFTARITNETFDLVEQIRVSEFWENVTRYEIEPTLVQCQSYNYVVQRLETAMYNLCTS